MMTTEMTAEMKDYLQMLMPYGTYAVKASDAEIKQFLLLCKQAEKNHSYQLAKYLCWLAKKNNTVLRAAVIEANGMMYLGVHYTMGGAFSQDYFPICKASERPAAWVKFIADEELTDDDRFELLTTTPRYMWEPVENFFNRIAVRWEDKADSSQQTWDEDEVDEDGFITAIRGGIYYSGKKILTSTDENEFRKGIGGTWFQEVK